MDDTPDLVIDPDPITADTLFSGPARSEAPSEALAFRGDRVDKEPGAADEGAIVSAETELGVRLPETLRRIYAMRNGGYVGHLVAPRVAAPRPVFEDWRGAFAPDYSSLRRIQKLETVASSYADLDTDPEDVPADAARLVILQARYGDMTLLDYTTSDSDPAVLIVDYDSGDDPVDMRFADFDNFLKALRRDRWREEYVYPSGRPLGETPEEIWPKLFWDKEAPHFYRNVAEWHKGDQLPAQRADEAMLAATEQRLRVQLPESLRAVLAAQNGGGAAAAWLGTGATRRRVIGQVAPIEFWVSFAELCERVVFPPAERPWAEGIEAADRLIVIDAAGDGALLLDYRNGGQPNLVVAQGLAAAQGVRLEDLGPFASLLPQLRHPT
ncbi:SMI1/KNR4 family protein [Sphingomonadaceae bacterium OTU29LAMAA1]|nr:SMI1/KNR4 family protein [Sphingomonadaceae bacterium OTU29LAMAA1]